ncbi:transcobalamin-2 [Larimichthys crocea]|uniref:transcobalamin-2 n=1 Tax=Larimichthys crocea TaxID=215358 RepID=UPI000F5E7E45|nr:transcobalamin-2 [Larimichthys crocea]
MLSLVSITSLLALVSGSSLSACGTDGSNNELLLSLSKNLLRSLETQEGLPNPSVHLALRLSDKHNKVKEAQYLKRLQTDLHNNLQSSLSKNEPVTGLMALYTLALKSSCDNGSTTTFTVNNKIQPLLTHLKKQMEQEKEHIHTSHRALTNYYQYSLGVLALCVSDVRVNNHVSNKLIRAVEAGHFTHGDIESIDTYAMAGMALQCVNNTGFHTDNVSQLDAALTKIKEKLLAARRTDGHIGNEFSTGNAVQALAALGQPVEKCGATMNAMRTDARNNKYHNPMAISQILPALHQKTYLSLREKNCENEDDTLVLEPIVTVTVLPSETKVTLKVEVVNYSKEQTTYSVEVPKGSTLLEALEILKQSSASFTFEKEDSLWGPYLSVVNGEKARRSDRRYWHLASNGTGLTEGVGDYKIQVAQKITIENTGY